MLGTIGDDIRLAVSYQNPNYILYHSKRTQKQRIVSESRNI